MKLILSLIFILHLFFLVTLRIISTNPTQQPNNFDNSQIPTKTSVPERAMIREGLRRGHPTGGGVPFDDSIDFKLPLMTPCVGVELFWYPEYLFALRFIYATVAHLNLKVYHGMPFDRSPPLLNGTFMMQNGERINKVTTYVGQRIWHVSSQLLRIIVGIQFYTTSGRSSPLYGSNEGEEYTESYEGFTFGYVKGGSGVLLDLLQIVWINREIMQLKEGAQFDAICPNSSTLVILSAIYRCKQVLCSESKDITNVVRKICGTNNSCSFIAEKKTFNLDSIDMQLKQFRITYTCTTQQYIFGPVLMNSDSVDYDTYKSNETQFNSMESIETCGEFCLNGPSCLGVVYDLNNRMCNLKHEMGITENGTSSMTVVNRDQYY